MNQATTKIQRLTSFKKCSCPIYWATAVRKRPRKFENLRKNLDKAGEYDIYYPPIERKAKGF
jgi:hypothetical protein